MKSGLGLGIAALLAVVLTPTRQALAQNLGLGTGSRMQAATDSAALDSRPERDEPANTRKYNRRLGLTARRNQVFDPKFFEARGREIQGQFYEIGTPGDAQQHGGMPLPTGGEAVAQQSGRKQWMIWVSVAGLAGASAGAVGYVLMSNAHPVGTPPPREIVLTDVPP